MSSTTPKHPDFAQTFIAMAAAMVQSGQFGVDNRSTLAINAEILADTLCEYLPATGQPIPADPAAIPAWPVEPTLVVTTEMIDAARKRIRAMHELAPTENAMAYALVDAIAAAQAPAAPVAQPLAAAPAVRHLAAADTEGGEA